MPHWTIGGQEISSTNRVGTTEKKKGLHFCKPLLHMVAHHQSKRRPIQLNLNDIKPENYKRYSLSYSHRKNQTNFESSTQ